MTRRLGLRFVHPSELWTPDLLATGASNWAWYDPSDISTLFQDSAGTTPVTATGDPVGRINDKSGNGNHATQGTSASRPIYRVSGGLKYLEFDGTDDSLVSSSISPGSVDKVQVFAGARKTANQRIVAEYSLNTGSNNGSFAMFAAGSGLTNTDEWNFRSKGTSIGNAPTGTTYVPPVTSVLTGLGDISGDSSIIRVDGVQKGSSAADQGTGNFGTYALYIGSRSAAANWLAGNLYGLIVRFSSANLDATTISNAETWMAAKTGVTL